MDDATIVPNAARHAGESSPAVTPPRNIGRRRSAPPTSQQPLPRGRHVRLGALWLLLLIFILLLIGPYLVGRFIYQTTYNELKAGYDVATGTLGDAQAAAQRLGAGLAAGGQARRAQRGQHLAARAAPASMARAPA